MEHRRHDQCDLVLPEVGIHHHVERVPGDVAVAEGGSLGPAGRPRRVHDQARVVQADRLVDLGRVGGGEQALVAGFPAQLPQRDHVPDPRHRAPQRGRRLRLPGPVDQRPRARVRQVAGQFRHGQPGVQRDQDRAQGSRGEQCLQECGVVGAEVGDPVAAAHAEPAQAVRQPGDPVMHLGVGQPVPGMQDRDPARGAAGAPGHPRADTVVAQPRIPSAGGLAPHAAA